MEVFWISGELFSEMLCTALDLSPEKGDLSGDCCICGKHTSYGFKKKFGANFTCGEYVGRGEVICPECYYIVSNSNEFRRTMFLLTEDELVKFKKKDIKEVLMNLPDKPFYIYLTKTWQKIGWIRMNDAYNNDSSGDIHIVVDYDIITTSLKSLKRLYSLASRIHSVGVSISALEHCELEIYHYRALVDEVGVEYARGMVKKLKVLKNNPVWLLAVYLI